MQSPKKISILRNNTFTMYCDVWIFFSVYNTHNIPTYDKYAYKVTLKQFVAEEIILFTTFTHVGFDEALSLHSHLRKIEFNIIRPPLAYWRHLTAKSQNFYNFPKFFITFFCAFAIVEITSAKFLLISLIRKFRSSSLPLVTLKS